MGRFLVQSEVGWRASMSGGLAAQENLSHFDMVRVIWSVLLSSRADITLAESAPGISLVVVKPPLTAATIPFHNRL